VDGFGKVAQVVKREVLEILPVTIFFLIGFNLIAFTKHLVLAEEGVVYDGIIVATVGALIIAKVVLVVDKLPILRFFRGRPLYRPILFRATFYTLCVLLVRLLEPLIRNTIHQGSLAGGIEAGRAEIVWQEFAFVQVWIFVLFVVYVAFVEVHTELGREPLTRIMFWRAER